MFEQEFGTAEPEDEQGLRAKIVALSAERVDPAQARLDYWRWDGLFFYPMLKRIGKGYIAWAGVIIIAADILVALAIRSLLSAIVCLVVLIILGIYEYTHFEGWVAEHNARVDERLRDLMERTRADGG
jgi:hypothetical protein